MKSQNSLKKMTLSALFLALAYVMPFLTGQIPEIGQMLCPLHIPVILCGFICGPIWGLTVGFYAPLFRSLTLGMPPLFPSAVCMAFELATYGLIAGLMHKHLSNKKIYTYISLLTSMLIGRIIWGISMLICTGINGNSFTFYLFLSEAFAKALPGILLQIALIPPIVMIIENKRVTKHK